MRALLIISSLTLAFAGCQLAKSQAEPAKLESLDSAQRKKLDFDADIKPIFQARCQPCHFQGGQVYEKLPFDKPATITKLGTKLFTRIKDEKERALIREFLDQK